MSQTLRVYLPATLPALARLRERGELAVPEGYAVTAALRDELGGDDPEQLAYAAFQLAADASLELLAADPAAPRRRVVVAADAPAAPAAPEPGHPGRVRLAAPVGVAAVAALHVDGPTAEPEVASAIASGEPVEHELEWYDVSELAQLLA
jgi:hypothetical protein